MSVWLHRGGRLSVDGRRYGPLRLLQLCFDHNTTLSHPPPPPKKQDKEELLDYIDEDQLADFCGGKLPYTFVAPEE